MGQHGMAVTQSKHLVGAFNLHLRDCIFLFADEAFFAGDPRNVGVLNALITEPTLTIEGNGANAFEAPNFLHIMMASNNSWVVPASVDERRYFVLDVGEQHMQDRPYFAAIEGELEAGGYGAMLYDLLHYDISGFNVGAVPDTAALQEQKRLSLLAEQLWWLDVLHRGYVWKSKLGLEDTFSTWHPVMSTEVLYASYTEFAQQRRERHPLDREAFGRLMTEMKCRHCRARNLIIGERIEDHPCSGRQANVVRRKGPSYGYRLGTLDLARAGFIAATNLPVDWQDDAPEID
jgi:Family of unknown function (DUF5906)